MHRTTVATIHAESLQLAQEHRHEARQASVDNVTQLRHFLTAAALYYYADRPDEVSDCLVSYGQAMARYQRARGKADLARDLVIEAIQLAVSRVTNILERQTALAGYVLDYLDDLVKEFGLPRGWPATVHSESQALLAIAQSLADPHLAMLLDLVKPFLTVIRDLILDQGFQDPIYRVAVIRRRLGTILRPREQDRWLAAIDHWTADLTQPTQETANRAQLEPSLLPILDLPFDVNELDLAVTVRNASDTPADCIQIILTADSKVSVQEPRKFISFLPGGATHAAVFRLTDISESAGYVELQLRLTYFDPVDRQETTIQAVSTLRRPDRPFQSVDNPYQVSWSPRRQFKPAYLNRGQAERMLTERAQGIGIEWTPGALSQALDLTGCESVTLEALGHQVVKYLNQAERTPPVVFDHDIEQVAETMINQWDSCPHFVALIESDQLSGVDKLILACFAARTDDATIWMRQDDLPQNLERWGSRLSADELFSRVGYLQSQLPLIEAEETPDGRYRYRLSVKLLYAWLRKHWLPGQALANLRQLQREDRHRLASVLREKLANVTGAHQAYQKAEHEYMKGFENIGQLTRLKQTYISDRNTLLFEIRGILTDEEYAELRELLDKVVAGESEKTIREALKVAARRRGWGETQVRQRIGGESGDILDQVAQFILDVWEV